MKKTTGIITNGGVNGGLSDGGSHFNGGNGFVIGDTGSYSAGATFHAEGTGGY